MSETEYRPRFAGYAELARAALRWSWLVVAATIAGGALAAVLTPPESDHSAIARVGLTTEVRWPFFDAARQRVSGIADATELDEIAAGLGDDVSLIRAEVSRPGDEAYLNVEIWADGPRSALDGANAYANHLVAEDTALYRQSLNANLATLDAQIVELDDVIETASARVERLTAEELVAQNELDAVRATEESDDAALTAYRRAQDELDVARQLRNQDLRRRSELLEDRDVLVTAIERDRNRVEVIRPAVPAETPVDRGTQAIIAGAVTGALVALAAAWVLERQFGRVESEGSLEEILDAPAIDARSSKGWERATLRIAGLASQPGGFVGIAGPPAVTRNIVNRLAAEAASARLTLILDPQNRSPDPLPEVHTRIVHVPASMPRGGGVLELRSEAEASRSRLAASTQLVVVELGDPDDDGWFELGLSICDSVVVATQGRVRPQNLRRTRRAIEAAGRAIDLGLLAKWGRTPMGPTREYETSQVA